MDFVDFSPFKKYNTVVCAIAKNEHLYVNEWVNHYVKLGFDKIFIFDNDDLDSKYIGDFIDSKLKSKVEIINKRGIHTKRFQHKCYQEFYNRHSRHFKWCLFCDLDEFLDGVTNIKDFLKTIPDNIGQVRIKWRLFGDDNLVDRDTTKPVYGFFKQVKDNKLSNQGKFIIRGNLRNVIIVSAHFASIKERNNIVPSCLPSTAKCKSTIEIEEDYSNEKIFLNHYMTKTLSEFIKQKINRGDACFENRTIDLEYYWRINDKTEEKLQWLKDNNYLE